METWPEIRKIAILGEKLCCATFIICERHGKCIAARMTHHGTGVLLECRERRGCAAPYMAADHQGSWQDLLGSRKRCQ